MGAMLSAGLLTGLTGCKKKEDSGNSDHVSADSANAIHVVAMVVQPHVFEDWGEYSADLRGVDDAVLTAPMGGGRVNQVSEVGRAVSAGDALCDIDTDRYHAALLQAQAAVDVAKGNVDRTQNNVDSGYVGKSMLDQAQSDYENARVMALQAQRAYEDSRCQAPFAGTLVSRFVDQFKNVAPAESTVRVANISHLEAEVSIPESEASDYREGQKADFQVLDGSEAPASGRIRDLDKAVEAKNRTVMARIEISNPGNQLRPGMIGKARILRKTYDQALVLPSQAVLRLQDGTAVMKVDDDGTAHKAPVTLGPANGDSVVVLTGVSAGDRVITVGAFEVTEGTKVAF
jgi:RND family efflux transporter MFP subunit